MSINKLEELKKLRDQLQLEIKGVENYPSDGPSLLFSNHNCLMDIFYLPMTIPGVTVSFISSRLIYKPILQRQEMIDRFLYAMPIEVHGGPLYSELCMRYASKLLNHGISVNIFPEGAYIEQNEVVTRGRTGVARILYHSRENGRSPYFVPVAIDVKKKTSDLDCYTPTLESVCVSILKPIDYESEYRKYINANTREEKNKLLHAITDKGMMAIASSLGRPYQMEYLPLSKRETILFASGRTLPTEEAMNPFYAHVYENELEDRYQNLAKCLGKRLSLY